MGVTALVMAGGKGTRMEIKQEKPLIDVCGKPVIQYVLEALQASKKIEAIVVAVSQTTPKTAQYLQNYPVKIVQTPGKDYVSDMGYAANALGLGVFLAVAADLPLLTGEVFDKIVERYEVCGKPALTVAVSLDVKKQLGMREDYAFDCEGKQVVPTGINVIDGRKRYGDEWLDQDILVLDMPEIAVNINTVKELQLAEQLLSQKITQKP
ncbi:MAG: NTP transferase domain-containing protein [Candidatus Bathyarchaeota archaeon]|nr:NTP transferase domain-containing protein [Candidatus Bathyarchaeota archaeon]